MSKKIFLIASVFVLVLVLSACQGMSISNLIPGSSANSGTTADQNGANRQNNFNFQSMPLEGKLGIGILKLEGTPKAITADQAKTMLPLWKALKTMSTSANTSADEINALYKQIEDTMTPDQVQAIKDLNLTGTDLRALEQQYNIQVGQGGGAFSNLTPEQRQTQVAQFRAQNGGNTGGGAFNGNRGNGNGGFGGFGGGGNNPLGGQAVRTPQPNAQRTPNPARRAVGMNGIFADAVIKVLTDRAGK